MPKRRRVDEGPLRNVARSVNTVRKDFSGLEKTLWQSEQEIEDLKEHLDKANALAESNDAELKQLREEVPVLKAALEQERNSHEILQENERKALRDVEEIKEERDSLAAENSAQSEKASEIRTRLCEMETAKCEVKQEVQDAWEKVDEYRKKFRTHHCAEVTYIKTLLELLEPCITDAKFLSSINATKHIALTEATRIFMDVDNGKETPTGLQKYRNVLQNGIQKVVRQNLMHQATTPCHVQTAGASVSAGMNTTSILKHEVAA